MHRTGRRRTAAAGNTPPGGIAIIAGVLDAKRYKLTVAYDGTAFHGWQRQEPAGQPVLRTGQGVLEEALVRVLRQPRDELALLGASRTDAGVHAIGQVCHLNTTSPIPPDRMVRAINSRLPDDIEVRAAEVVAPEFDAIRDATDKQYRYRIFDAPYRPWATAAKPSTSCVPTSRRAASFMRFTSNDGRIGC